LADSFRKNDDSLALSCKITQGRKRPEKAGGQTAARLRVGGMP
jgi:hypothetical protein